MPFQARYTGPSLADALCPPAAFEAIDRACHDIVRTGEDIVHRTASAATPYKTGALRDSWLSMPVERIAGGYSGTVSNSHWLANIANYGSEAHVIRPDAKRAEAYPGAPHPSAVIHHPGTEPQFMVERALDTLAATIPWAGERAVSHFIHVLELGILAESGKIR